MFAGLSGSVLQWFVFNYQMRNRLTWKGIFLGERVSWEVGLFRCFSNWHRNEWDGFGDLHLIFWCPQHLVNPNLDKRRSNCKRITMMSLLTNEKRSACIAWERGCVGLNVNEYLETLCQLFDWIVCLFAFDILHMDKPQFQFVQLCLFPPNNWRKTHNFCRCTSFVFNFQMRNRLTWKGIFLGERVSWEVGLFRCFSNWHRKGFGVLLLMSWFPPCHQRQNFRQCMWGCVGLNLELEMICKKKKSRFWQLSINLRVCELVISWFSFKIGGTHCE